MDPVAGGQLITDPPDPDPGGQLITDPPDPDPQHWYPGDAHCKEPGFRIRIRIRIRIRMDPH
jgi:hypothetical protein